MHKIKNDLEVDFMILLEWFHENHIALNPGKCLTILSSLIMILPTKQF